MGPNSVVGGGPLWWAGFSILGLATGLAAGLFGVGGGFLLIPLMNVLFGVPLEAAIGTGLCQTIGTAVAAFSRQRRLRLGGEPKVAWLMVGGALVGVQAGARAVRALNHEAAVQFFGRSIPAVDFWLSLAYTVLLAGTGLWMLRDARIRPTSSPLGPGPLTRVQLPPYTWLPNCSRRVSVLGLAYAGLFTGFLTGLMGLGGGIVLMPLLIYGIGMRIKAAAGTSILLLLATATAGTLAHASMGHVHLGLAIVLLAGSTLGAPIGASLSAGMDGRRLRGLFAGLIFTTALAVFWNLLRKAV